MYFIWRGITFSTKCIFFYLSAKIVSCLLIQFIFDIFFVCEMKENNPHHFLKSSVELLFIKRSTERDEKKMNKKIYFLSFAANIFLCTQDLFKKKKTFLRTHDRRLSRFLFFAKISSKSPWTSTVWRVVNIAFLWPNFACLYSHHLRQFNFNVIVSVSSRVKTETVSIKEKKTDYATLTHWTL